MEKEMEKEIEYDWLIPKDKHDEYVKDIKEKGPITVIWDCGNDSTCVYLRDYEYDHVLCDKMIEDFNLPNASDYNVTGQGLIDIVDGVLKFSIAYEDDSQYDITENITIPIIKDAAEAIIRNIENPSVTENLVLKFTTSNWWSGVTDNDKATLGISFDSILREVVEDRSEETIKQFEELTGYKASENSCDYFSSEVGIIKGQVSGMSFTTSVREYPDVTESVILIGPDEETDEE